MGKGVSGSQGGSPGVQRRRKQRRLKRFAWQSSGSSGDASGSVEPDGDERSSTASSSGDAAEGEIAAGSYPAGCDTVVWHTSVMEADYIDLRARGVDAATKAATQRPLPAPQGAAAVARRRARLLALRKDSGGAVQQWPAPALQEVAAQLRGRGFMVADAFCGLHIASALRRGVEALDMRPGHLGGAVRSASLRGDLVAWPELAEATPFGAAMRDWLRRLDALISALASQMRRPGELAGVRAREPPMASCYPPGARYIRHYDNNCEDGEGSDCNGRRLTAVYYLSSISSDAEGGHLRLASWHRRTYDIAPVLDTLVLFWADRRTPHEVLPNNHTMRYALSCWYVDLDEASNDAAEPMPS